MKNREVDNGREFDFGRTSAEDNGCPTGAYYAVSSVQCFWYFDRERMKAEIKRLLKPGGIFVKVYVGWIKDDHIASASSALVREINPDWNSGSVAVADLKIHIFDNPIMESFCAELPFTRESWHGRMLTCRGVLGSMDGDMLERFEKRHLALMSELPEKFTVRHKIFITAYRLS